MESWARLRVPVKNSIYLFRVNLRHCPHRGSGRVLAQTPWLILGCRDDIRDLVLVSRSIVPLGLPA